MNLHPSPVLLALGILACAPDIPSNVRVTKPAPDLIRLTLVGTNDLHGWVYPQEFGLVDGTTATEGGLSTFAGYLSILRKQNAGRVLLIDGGDLFQGTLPSNLTEGAVVIDGMNVLGYAAAALGNHEFDYGPVGPAPVPVKPGDDPLGALKARIRQAKFPILSANVVEAKTGKVPDWLGNDGTRLVELAGLKVGIVGLSTPTTPSVTNPVNVAELRFLPAAPAALKAAQSLRARGAIAVILVAHVGGKCGSLANPNDVSSCDPGDGEIFGLLEELPPGTVDAVIAGHTHQPLGHFIHGVPVVETPGLGRSFALIELFVDPGKRAVVRERTRITPMVPLCTQVDAELATCDAKKLRTKKDVKLIPATFRGEPVVADAALTTLMAPAKEAAQALQQRSLGVTVPRTLTRKYDAESPLGLTLADALRGHEKADLALLNPGGIRADVQAGELLYGEVYEVLPFDNTIATIKVNGDQLKRLLAAAYGSRRGVFQISGAKVELGRCPGTDRLQGFTLESGKPVVADREYRVVMPDFLARGGDGLGQVLRSLPPGAIDLGEARPDNFRDAVAAYWEHRKAPVAAPEPGRIRFVGEEKRCAEAESAGTR